MSVHPSVEAALRRQRDRACAAIISVADDSLLTDDEHAAIRKATLDALNLLHRETLEIVDAAVQGMSVNQLHLSLLAQVHQTPDTDR